MHNASHATDGLQGVKEEAHCYVVQCKRIIIVCGQYVAD